MNMNMDMATAYAVLTEMQKWRRGEAPYDGDTPDDRVEMPYSPKEFGEAIDMSMKAIDKLSKIADALL